MLKARSFLTLLDFTPEEIGYLIDLAAKLKDEKKKGIPHKHCVGKNIALVFEKTSTRTRCAFEVAAADLGMHPVYLDPKSSQIGKKESIADTVRLRRYAPSTAIEIVPVSSETITTKASVFSETPIAAR